jgi:hypothetical protein
VARSPPGRAMEGTGATRTGNRRRQLLASRQKEMTHPPNGPSRSHPFCPQVPRNSPREALQTQAPGIAAYHPLRLAQPPGGSRATRTVPRREARRSNPNRTSPEALSPEATHVTPPPTQAERPRRPTASAAGRDREPVIGGSPFGSGQKCWYTLRTALRRRVEPEGSTFGRLRASAGTGETYPAARFRL